MLIQIHGRKIGKKNEKKFNMKPFLVPFICGYAQYLYKREYITYAVMSPVFFHLL